MKKVLLVEGMMCMHCAGSVEKALLALPGINSAEVDLANKTCTVEGDLPSEDSMNSAVEGQGFKVAEIREV